MGDIYVTVEENNEVSGSNLSGYKILSGIFPSVLALVERVAR